MQTEEVATVNEFSAFRRWWLGIIGCASFVCFLLDEDRQEELAKAGLPTTIQILIMFVFASLVVYRAAMPLRRSRWPGLLTLMAAILGLLFFADPDYGTSPFWVIMVVIAASIGLELLLVIRWHRLGKK